MGFDANSDGCRQRTTAQPAVRRLPLWRCSYIRNVDGAEVLGNGFSVRKLGHVHQVLK